MNARFKLGCGVAIATRTRACVMTLCIVDAELPRVG